MYRSFSKKPYHQFGRFEKDVKHIPYWTKNFPVKVLKGGENIYLTAWTRSDQARLLISNMSETQSDVSLKVDLAELGLDNNAVVLDERSGYELPIKDGVINVPVRRHDYECLILAKPGMYKPLAKNHGDSLEPPKNLWIKRLCDSFSTLDPKWQKNVATDLLAKKKWGKNFEIVSGMLRVRGTVWTYSNLITPFNEDNCSVQIEVREPFFYPYYVNCYGDGIGPGLQLVWADGSWISMRGWERQPKGKSSNFYCVGYNAKTKKKVFSKLGEQAGIINWMKITLAKDNIEFHYSTDGNKWQLLYKQPRKEFTGAPKELVIGNGYKTQHHKPCNAEDSFFDNLITAKLPKKQ
jgi:hypothetical protein